MAPRAATAVRAADGEHHSVVTMPADAKTPYGFSLKRWSRRKHEAAREAAHDAVSPVPAAPPVPPVSQQVAGAPAAAAPPVSLPPVESLTADSDFTAFLQPQVDEAVKRQALKKLFADPRFNVMDGLDVYIDDYTKTVPIPPDILERLLANISFNPPVAPEEKPQSSAAEAVDDAVPAAPELPARPAEKPADSADTGPQDPVPPQ